MRKARKNALLSLFARAETHTDRQTERERERERERETHTGIPRQALVKGVQFRVRERIFYC